MPVLRAVLVVVAILAAVAPLPASVVERWYSRGFYARLQPVATSVSSVVPFALLDVAVAVLIVAAGVAVARRARRDGWRRALRSTAWSAVVLAAVVYLWFLLFWGLNYRRVPLEQKLAYEPGRVSREQALALARLAVDQVNALEPSRPRESEHTDLAQSLAAIEQLLGARVPARVAPAKRSLVTWYFRKAGIDGMTDPFFLEIIVNPDLLPFERPFTLAHEWAHLAGYADESEANFVAWLTCVRGTPAARYSGWLTAYQQLTGVLPREDRKALRSALRPTVIADLQAIGERLARASPRVSMAARGAYDAYLRANRIEEGIASYGLVVRLMTGTTFHDGWTPELRAGDQTR